MSPHRAPRRYVGMLVAAAAAAALFLTGCNPYDNKPLTVKAQKVPEAVRCEPTGTAPGPSAIGYDAGGPYLVESVVDGDTLRISCNGTSTRVRLVGVNTPETETMKEDSPVECGGPEASEYLHSQLEGKDVFLSVDPAQGERDKYDRLLAYVWTADGALVNESIVELGHGEATGYGKDYAMSRTFEAAAEKAKDKALGLWACPLPPAHDR
ncbi:thermonuclease family protein [Pseudarthrobacter raffinosi]|uniref:thermonuclease family protein n=1 Tax=Pseudarthrobacter raffinosi TaxID=2953651 RepID=UPI00208EB3D3|nr:thermonuclease family protein [Pseudarthrobacter sp. MDT3-9]MCO4253365.1 thermonuclease family protein [Pseudarthrobacter sp. MDT3-9]